MNTGKKNKRSIAKKKTKGQALSPILGKPQTGTNRTSESRNRALAALGRMRRELVSLSEACRKEHIKPATFRRYVGSAVRQDKPGGRFRATAGDSFRRDVHIPTAQGQTVISVRGSKNARLIANYSNAVAEYLRTGKREKLDSFKGKTVKVDGKNMELITDHAVLLQLAEADAHHFDQLYAFTVGRG